MRPVNLDDGDNGCDYSDGLDNTDPNIPVPGAWSIRRTNTNSALPSGWNLIQSTWYNPPSSDALDVSIWLEGYADLPGTSSPGKIIIDDMTVEGT